MCVLAVAIRPCSKWLLVAAGNRDEFHTRPTQALGRWDDHPHILAGRDLRSGGTWLGVSERGRFASVTNVSAQGDPSRCDLSRGQLVLRYLDGEPLDEILCESAVNRFGPFNLVTFDGGEAAEFASNVPRLVRAPVGPRVFVLSNSMRNAPLPKTRKLQGAVENWLRDPAAEPIDLLELLGPDHRVDTSRELGRSPDRASSIFVRDSTHGTRSSSVITIDAVGKGLVMERQFDCAGEISGESALQFSWRTQTQCSM